MTKASDQSGGNVDAQNEKLKKLSENGKFEIKELSLKQGEKTYTAIIKADFDLLKKAHSALLATKFTTPKKGEKKEGAGVEIEMDLLAAGDKILFFGWHEGDEVIRERAVLRMRATQMLGEWFTGLIDVDEDEGEKKS